MIDIATAEPDFVNEIGTKWWIERAATRYAHTPNSDGVSLPDMTVYLTQTVNGEKAYLIVDTEIRFESKQLEAIGVRLDLLKMAKGKR